MEYGKGYQARGTRLGGIWHLRHGKAFRCARVWKMAGIANKPIVILVVSFLLVYFLCSW